jgi:L-threonylcarbamoyladenylate synthase
MAAVIGRYKLRLAVRCLQVGGVIAYPTEAVYGLGCDPLSQGAVQRIRDLKGRPARKGLILVAADFGQLLPFVEPLDAARMAHVFGSWPGPVTWLLPARRTTSPLLTGPHSTLAVRVTAHPVAAALCRAWGGALVSTSANRSGRPPARTGLQVRLRLGPQVDFLLNGPCGGRSRPSTIRDGRSGAEVRP